MERCPHLEYRESAGGKSFDAARAYCGAVEAFVEAMRADICNCRYDLDPREHCEFYREAHGDDGRGGDSGSDGDGRTGAEP